MQTSPTVPSVNFHLWQPCNMRCGFCFARFADIQQGILPKGHLTRDHCIRVVEHLGAAAFEKINFAGGEPLLCPWLPELIQVAKSYGMTTSVVTNGTRITRQWLDSVERSLDWIAISVDTLDPERLKRIGRVASGEPLSQPALLGAIEDIQRHGIRLKINTVVTAETWDDELGSFIALVRPERWKILQALLVADQNGEDFDRFAIDRDQFEAYLERNVPSAPNGVVVVAESNDLMRGSYVMVDPAGRFFDNVQGKHSYSRPILDVGGEEALRDVVVDQDIFHRRGGSYDWKVPMPNVE